MSQPPSQQPMSQPPSQPLWQQPLTQAFSQQPLSQQSSSQRPPSPQPLSQQQEVKEERRTPRLTTPVRDMRDPSPFTGPSSPTRIQTDQIKQEVSQIKNRGKNIVPVFMPAVVRVVSYYPKDIRNFTIRICSNCRHNYGGDKAGPICPTCNRRDILDYEYWFELGLEDEFGQQYAATVDNASAKILLKNVNSGNLYKKHDLREKILQSLALVGVIKGSQEEQARSTTFFKCCLRLSNDGQSSSSQYDVVAPDRTSLSRSGYQSQEEESGQEVLSSTNSAGTALKRKAAEESQQSAKKRLHLDQAIHCKLVYTAIN